MNYTNLCSDVLMYPPLMVATLIITFIAVTSSMLLKKVIPNQMYESLKEGRPEFSLLVNGGGSYWKMLLTSVISLEYFLTVLKIKRLDKSWLDLNMIEEKNRKKFAIYSILEIVGLLYFFIVVFLINGSCELFTDFSYSQ